MVQWSVPEARKPSMWRPSRKRDYWFQRRWRCGDSQPARWRSRCTETCKSSAGASPPRLSQFRNVSAMVARTSIRSCSSRPESGQPAGSESQTSVKVSRRRRRSPLFHAERRILACCSETDSDFVFSIMRVTHLISRRRPESLNFFGTSSRPVPNMRLYTTFRKKPEILSGLCDMIITDQLIRGGFGWMPEITNKRT
jgi:hypothetical protein